MEEFIRKSIADRLNGEWVNELGSRMELVVEGSRLTGWYETAVSIGQTRGHYPLIGYVNTSSITGTPVLSFIVGWDNETTNLCSTTAWVGYLEEEGILHTTWLLVHEAIDNRWANLRVGHNHFRRVRPRPGF